MKKPTKLFSRDQANNISNLILSIAAKAYVKGEIGFAEKEAIINFTAQCEAFYAVFEEEGLIQK